MPFIIPGRKPDLPPDDPPTDPEDPPGPTVLTDELRALALAEIQAHAAPSTWRRLVRSLRERDYPLRMDPYLTRRRPGQPTE